jgi:hypothetical protein
MAGGGQRARHVGGGCLTGQVPELPGQEVPPAGAQQAGLWGYLAAHGRDREDGAGIERFR